MCQKCASLDSATGRNAGKNERNWQEVERLVRES